MYKLTKQALWGTRNLNAIVWNSGCLVYSELSNILPGDVECEYFATKRKKSEFPGKLMEKECENLYDHGCHKIHELVDPYAEKEVWICSSYPFGDKTTPHCVERKFKLLGNWTMEHLNL